MSIYKRRYSYPHHERFSIAYTPEALEWLTTAFKHITCCPELVFADEEHQPFWALWGGSCILGCNGRSFETAYVDKASPFYYERSQFGSKQDGIFCVEIGSYTDTSGRKRLYIEFDHQDYGDDVKLPLLETLLVKMGAVIERME